MNFIEIFQQYGVDYAQYGQHEHARKGWIQTDCPYCSPGWKHFRLGFNIRGMYASCWSCGPHRLHDCLMALCGISFSECKELLGTYDALLPETKEFHTIRRGKVKLPEGVKKMRIEHRNYLLKRGLNPTTIANKWGVKGIGMADRLQWRLFIPIFFDFETISWTTRSISDEVEKRYIKADLEDEKFPANTVLYGEDFAKHTIVVCYTPDTDILTDHGWIPFPQLTTKHKVAQYKIHPDDTTHTPMPGVITFTHPKAIQQFNCNENLINIKNRWADLLITQNHRVLHRRQKCNPKVTTAKNVTTNTAFPTAGIYKSHHRGPTPLQARLLICFLADGHWEHPRGQRIRWAFRKERKKRRIKYLLQQLKIHFDESDTNSRDTWFAIDKKDVPFFDYLEGTDKKQLPICAMHWPHKTRRAMLHELQHWDGDCQVHGIRFFTSEQNSAQTISAIASLTGFSCVMRTVKPKRQNHKPEFVLNLIEKSWRTNVKQPQQISYQGAVYCCTVDTGFIVVRRNGRTMVSGNCEGVMDVWKIGPGAVATMGTMYTQAQLFRMMRFPRRIICFDADKPGQMRAKNLIEALSACEGETFNVVLESAKDAGAASSKEVKQIRKLAFGSSRYNDKIPHVARPNFRR